MSNVYYKTKDHEESKECLDFIQVLGYDHYQKGEVIKTMKRTYYPILLVRSDGSIDGYQSYSDPTYLSFPTFQVCTWANRRQS